MHGCLFLLKYFVLPWKIKTSCDVAHWDFNHSKSDSGIKDPQLDLNSLVNKYLTPPHSFQPHIVSLSISLLLPWFWSVGDSKIFMPYDFSTFQNILASSNSKST